MDPPRTWYADIPGGYKGLLVDVSPLEYLTSFVPRARAPPHPTPRKFPSFEKLPLEIRRRIWNLSFAPRLVRIGFSHVSTENSYTQIYGLSAGPVPRLLHVNHESRIEGLRIFTLVASHIPVASSRLTPQSVASTTRKIFVDLEHDIFYHTSSQTSTLFLSWLNKFANKTFGGAGKGVAQELVEQIDHTAQLFIVLPKSDDNKVKDIDIAQTKNPGTTAKVSQKKRQKRPDITQPKKPMVGFYKFKPGNGIRHLAFPIDQVTDSPKPDIELFLAIAMGQPKLKTINIVVDLGKFSSTKVPHQYTLKDTRSLMEWLIPTTTQLPKGRSGGSATTRAEIKKKLENFWTKQRDTQTLAWRKTLSVNQLWAKWIADEKREEEGWVAPEFVVCGLEKINKHVL